MKNNHNVEIYDNGHGDRIAFVFQGARRILNIEEAKTLKESLEYGLAKTHLTPAAPDSEGRCSCVGPVHKKTCPVHIKARGKLRSQ